MRAEALDVGGLDDHQGGAGIGQHAEMHQVPVIGAAVVGGILAHRRDDQTVGKLKTCQLDRRKKRTLLMGMLEKWERAMAAQRCWMEFR